MYNHIYQNSYVVAIIVFILLCVVFYLFEIGYSTRLTENGEIEKTFSWSYPLAITLIVWVIWHFVLFPTKEIKSKSIYSDNNLHKTPNSSKDKIAEQCIDMTNWN